MRKRLAAAFLAMLLLLVQALPAVACAAKCSMGHCDEAKQTTPAKTDHGCCDENPSSETNEDRHASKEFTGGHHVSEKKSQRENCNCGCQITSVPTDQGRQEVAAVQVQSFSVLAILTQPIEVPHAPITYKLAGIRAQDSGPPGSLFSKQSHSRAPPVLLV